MSVPGVKNPRITKQAKRARTAKEIAADEQTRTRWRKARGWIAGGVIGALVVTVAVVSSGFDAREVLRQEPNVWVARDAGQYARVNTDTGEIDTVRKVAEPSGVIQIGSESVVLANGNGKAWPVNAALPLDFLETSGSADQGGADQGGTDADAEDADSESTDSEDSATEEASADGEGAGVEAVRMPDGTREVLVSGAYVLVRSEAGAVYLGSLADSSATYGSIPPGELASKLKSLKQIDPLAEEAAKAAEQAAEAEADGEAGTPSPETDLLGLRADAIALSPNGIAAMYSSTDGTVWRFDAKRDAFVGGADELPAEAEGLADSQLAIVSGDWVLFNEEAGTLWRAGSNPVQLELSGAAKLQASGDGDGEGAGGGTAALIADASGLWRVSQQGAAERIAEAEGTPARPQAFDGTRFAAWIGQSSGTLWTSEEGLKTLEFDESAKDPGEVAPVFYTNGERAVLGETRTGMLWTLPEGRLIPLSQWTISDPPKEDQGTVVVDEVTDQVAPTALDDAFGVRDNEPAPLQVLLNDFDPNRRDVLTIVPESLSESPLPEEFGTLELMPDGQSLMVRPKQGASGSAKFTYRVTDGALNSNPATVTLNVVGSGTNSAPEWCPVEGCQRSWTVPPIAPGGTLVYPILEGWVDPEGDPMMLASVEALRSEDPVTALVTADGRLAVRHTDVNSGGAELMLRVTVRDARGAEQTRDLQVPVQQGAQAEFQAMAASVQVDSPTVLKPLERAAGGSGSFQLLDVLVQSGGERVKASARVADGTVQVVASDAGSAVISLTLRDIGTGHEFSGLLRVNATPGIPPLTLPPLRAFVRPLSDSTVEILNAIPNSGSRPISVQAASVVDGELRADVIAHSRVRVAGSTPDGGPGRIGSVDVTVSEGAAGAQGRLTVFQVAESGSLGAVAVSDIATVRAGSVVDIRVLDNDVAAPGERLILHPEVTGSGAEGELAFASGSTLRYLAPTQPGTYKLSYTTYGASTPQTGDVGSVTVNVLPRGANQDPTPAVVTVRVSPGEQAEGQVPLSGVDPDGDRVRITGVGQVENAQVTASVSANGTALAVTASAQAEAGLTLADYTVTDGQGGTGKGQLRIIVTSASTDVGAPIASSDYLRLVRGSESPVSVRPLDNDLDPALGNLQLVSVEPNVPGGTASPEYQELFDRLDLSAMKQGIVSVMPGAELGTVSYKYTVKSTESSSTSDGLLLVQTSERVGAQAPRVTDTVLNVRERGELSAGGVDVVTDKVRWAAGDPASLELSLWEGNSGRYQISGKNVTGDYNPDGDLVAFKLTGIDASGAEVESYGFLIIPPLDELRVTLKPGLQPISVDENKSVDAGIRTFLDLGPQDNIELAQESFPVGRSQATCEAISGSEIRYTAGGEAPWADTCLVSARLVGQKNWTQLPVPVSVVPRAPVVQLSALTRTLAPGSAETIDLFDMVNWQGERAGDTSKLQFAVSGGGSLFAVAQAGSSVTVEARADAIPGSQEGLTVTVTGEGDSLAPLTLRIGEAAKDQPRGGTVNLTCTVGSACAIDVIGAPGEYDPFAGKTGGGLTLDTVSTQACGFGTVSRTGDRGVSVAWSDAGGPGGRCTVGFTVRDAQGRTGEGSIELDAQGLPRPPSSLTPQSFSGDSVTFIVELGAAQSAHPAVSGVEVSGAGSSSCTPAGPASYQCVVSGLENGAQHSFTARAVNAVGASLPSSPATAWAYKTPAAPTVTSILSVRDDRVTQSHGVIEFSLQGEPDVRGYQVTVGGVSAEYTGRNVQNERLVVPVGSQSFSAVPLSTFEPPSGAPVNGAAAQEPVTVIGSPIGGELKMSSPGNKQLAATVVGVDSNSAPGSSLRYFFTGPGSGFGGPPECTNDLDAYGANSASYSVNNHYKNYTFRGCVTNGYGWTDVGVKRTSALSAGGGEIPRPGGKLTYSVNPTATISGVRGEYKLPADGAPDPLADAGLTLQYFINGAPADGFSLTSDHVSTIEVRQCADFDDESTCSGFSSITPTGAPTTAWAELAAVCVPAGDAKSVVNTSQAIAPFLASAVGDATGKVTITWGGSFSSLTPLVLQGTACAVDPPEEPEDPPLDPPTDPPATP